jgi:hypothetical protein
MMNEISPLAKLLDYNEKIESFDTKDGDVEKFLRNLSERNKLLVDITPRIDFYPTSREPARNKAFIDCKDIQDPEVLAFHVGAPNQGRLYVLREQKRGTPYNEGIFFGTTPQDVNYFLRLKRDPLLMVYFSNMQESNGTRVQTNYESPVISRWDLEELTEIPEISKKRFRKKHKAINRKWIKKNTRPLRDKDIKKETNQWILIPGPIEVNYQI